MVLLASLLVSLAVTGVMVAGFFMAGAVVAAGFVVLFYGALWTLRISERRSMRGDFAAHGELAPDEPEVVEVAADPPAESVVAERAQFRLALAVAAPLAALAFVLAAVFLGLQVAGLGALAFFALMIFMGAPVWLAAVEDEVEDAEEREDLPHPPSSR